MAITCSKQYAINDIWGIGHRPRGAEPVEAAARPRDALPDVGFGNFAPLHGDPRRPETTRSAYGCARRSTNILDSRPGRTVGTG